MRQRIDKCLLFMCVYVFIMVLVPVVVIPLKSGRSKGGGFAVTMFVLTSLFFQVPLFARLLPAVGLEKIGDWILTILANEIVIIVLAAASVLLAWLLLKAI